MNVDRIKKLAGVPVSEARSTDEVAQIITQIRVFEDNMEHKAYKEAMADLDNINRLVGKLRKQVQKRLA